MNTDVTISRDYLRHLQTSLPSFWEMKSALQRVQKIKCLQEFYTYVLTEGNQSYSQLFQDLFVDFVFSKARSKRFLEFGATNGVELSNSLMLERIRGWEGVLAEPDPQWHSELFKNRPTATIITDCIYSRTGETMSFVSSSTGVLSSLEKHAKDDANGPLSGNAAARLSHFNKIDVKTISLNDVFEIHFNGEPIEYMSVDTEGSELEILSSFDFKKYHPSIVTVEHNFTDAQPKLDALFFDNGYARIFSECTNFDAWYVLSEFARSRQLI